MHQRYSVSKKRGERSGVVRLSTHRHKDTARTLHLVVSRVEEDRRRCVEVLLINDRRLRIA